MRKLVTQARQDKEMLETKRHDKTKLSVLEHQTWWERSSKERNARKQKRHDKTKLSVLKHQTWWERSSKERNARKQKDTTRRSSAYSNIKRGGRGAQKKETLENKKTRQDEAQYTRTSNVVGEELKRKKRSKTKKHDKTKLSVLEHQTWWERSSKRKEGDVQRKGRSNV